MDVTIKREQAFAPLYNIPETVNLVFCIGGRGGMKTYEVSKYVAVMATMQKKRCCILRDEKELIRESILNEVLIRYDTANENSGLALDTVFDRLDTGIKDKKTGNMVVFTKGFRASNSDKKANLKSISDVDIAVIEEAEDIREDKFNTFMDSIRNKGAVVIVVLNTPDVGHWIVKRYFNTEPVPGEDGYFKITPKKLDNVLVIQTTFRDNPHLPENVIQRYEAYGDPDSPMYNKHHYLTNILGYATTGLKGQILKHAKPITTQEYHNLPYREIYGQDFGTAAPAGLVGIKFHRNKVWVRELNYKPMTALELGKLYCRLGFNAADLIVADSAEPKTIAKLRNGWRPSELTVDDFEMYPRLSSGFNVVGALKGRDSVTAGLTELIESELYITEDSANLWNEVNHYVYAEDKNGNPTNEPIDAYNHLIDPTRYAYAEAKKPRANAPSSV
jgi:phage terminase large subunit